MTGNYDNTNTGILTQNADKKQPNHPDYRGSVNIEGREYWLSGWKKVGKSGKLEGKSFLSLTAQPKEDRQPANSRGRSQQRQASNDGFDDGDVPF